MKSEDGGGEAPPLHSEGTFLCDLCGEIRSVSLLPLGWLPRGRGRRDRTVSHSAPWQSLTSAQLDAPGVARRGEGAREGREPRGAAPARGDKSGLAARLARSALSLVD